MNILFGLNESLNTANASLWTLCKARLFGKLIVKIDGDSEITCRRYQGRTYLISRRDDT